jgi:hypothetical protein
MATTNIRIPTELNSGYERRNFRLEVQQWCAGSDNVQFVDDNGNEACPQYINVSADAKIMCRSKGAADMTKHDEYYAAKGWHPFNQTKIYGTGTTASIVITIRCDD